MSTGLLAEPGAGAGYLPAGSAAPRCRYEPRRYQCPGASFRAACPAQTSPALRRAISCHCSTQPAARRSVRGHRPPPQRRGTAQAPSLPLPSSRHQSLPRGSAHGRSYGHWHLLPEVPLPALSPPPIRTLGSPQHRGSMRDADALTHPWGSPSCGRSRLHPKGCVSPPIHSGSRAGSIPWERSDDGGELLGLHPQAPAASTWTPFPAVRSNGSGAPALGIESSVTGAELPQDVGPRGSFPAGKQPKSPPRAPRRGSAAPEAPE